MHISVPLLLCAFTLYFTSAFAAPNWGASSSTTTTTWKPSSSTTKSSSSATTTSSHKTTTSSHPSPTTSPTSKTTTTTTKRSSTTTSQSSTSPAAAQFTCPIASIAIPIVGGILDGVLGPVVPNEQTYPFCCGGVAVADPTVGTYDSEVTDCSSISEYPFSFADCDIAAGKTLACCADFVNTGDATLGIEGVGCGPAMPA